MSSQQLEPQQIEQQEYPRIVGVKSDDETNDTFLKAFLISDKLNKMNWQIPDNALKKYVSGFIGKPLIQHPSGLHPDYEKEGLFLNSPTFIQDILNHQEQYAVGDIVDVQYEPIKSASGQKSNDNAWFAYIRLRGDKQNAITSLKSAAKKNETVYVSPQIIDLDGAGPNEKTFNFVPTHLAIVTQPAYGAHAKIKGACNGSKSKCVQELKSAAYVLNTQIQQLENEQDNSSLFENSNTNQYITMPQKSNNSITDQVLQSQQQQGASVMADPNIVQTQTNQPQGQEQKQGQPLSEKKQITELTADGKLVTKTEVAKPANNNGQQPQQAFNSAPLATLIPQNPEAATTDPTLNNIPTNNVQQPQQTEEVAFDWNKLPKEMKQLFENYNNLLKKVEDVENFKRNEEENRVKQAAEQQRAQIEQALSVIQDDNVRNQLVEFFVGLPLSDDQMNNLLNLLISGTFSPDASSTNGQTGGGAGGTPATNAPPAAKKPRGFPAKPGLKSAAFINTGSRFATPIEYSSIDDEGSASSLFGDLDLGNI